jgi:hypothetical protein
MDISLKYDLLRNEAANGYRRQFYDVYMAPLSIKQNSCHVWQVSVFMHLIASWWKITISNVKFADKRPGPCIIPRQPRTCAKPIRLNIKLYDIIENE